MWQQLELPSELESDWQDTIDWVMRWLCIGGFYIDPSSKTSSKNTEALLRSMKFLFPDVAFYLYKSTIQSFMEYCCYIWAGAFSCYLDMLDKLQKWICETAVYSLTTFLKPLLYFENLSSLSFLRWPRQAIRV